MSKFVLKFCEAVACNVDLYIISMSIYYIVSLCLYEKLCSMAWCIRQHAPPPAGQPRKGSIILKSGGQPRSQALPSFGTTLSGGKQYW